LAIINVVGVLEHVLLLIIELIRIKNL